MNNGEILNCYNVGYINTKGGTDRATGGISGFASGNTMIINSYNAGIITTENGTGGVIFGQKTEGNNVTENCYYLENTVNGGNGTNIEGADVKTSEELKNIYTLLGSNFKKDTNIINNGYPILYWQ